VATEEAWSLQANPASPTAGTLPVESQTSPAAGTLPVENQASLAVDIMIHRVASLARAPLDNFFNL